MPSGFDCIGLNVIARSPRTSIVSIAQGAYRHKYGPAIASRLAFPDLVASPSRREFSVPASIMSANNRTSNIHFVAGVLNGRSDSFRHRRVQDYRIAQLRVSIGPGQACPGLQTQEPPIHPPTPVHQPPTLTWIYASRRRSSSPAPASWPPHALDRPLTVFQLDADLLGQHGASPQKASSTRPAGPLYTMRMRDKRSRPNKSR